MAQLNDLLVTGGVRINSDALLDSDLYMTNGYIRGENSQTTNHAIKLGHAGSDLMNFYEYGGVFNFYKSVSGTDTLLGKINTSGWVGSAALSGTPTAPTAAAGTNTTQIATTAFTTTAINNAFGNNIKYQTSDPGKDSALTTGRILLIYEA